MKTLFNLMHRLRNHRPTFAETVLTRHLQIEKLAAYLRGFQLGARGLLRYPNRFQKIAVGPTSRSIFQPGARIEIAWSDQLAPLESLENQYLNPPISLGLNLPATFLNPAEPRKNRFRLLTHSVFQIRGRVNIGQGFYISLKENARLTVGDKVYIGKRFYCAAKTEVEIGAGCIIGDDVKIIDYDGYQIREKGSRELVEDLGGQSGKVTIEKNVWIAWNVMITKGVTIGEGSIVASNSFVTRSVPPHSLVMGNPAKVVKEDVTWQNF